MSSGGSAGNAECWSGALYTAARCCDVTKGPTGDVRCWSGSFDFQFCCPDAGQQSGASAGHCICETGAYTGDRCQNFGASSRQYSVPLQTHPPTHSHPGIASALVCLSTFTSTCACLLDSLPPRRDGLSCIHLRHQCVSTPVNVRFPARLKVLPSHALHLSLLCLSCSPSVVPGAPPLS